MKDFNKAALLVEGAKDIFNAKAASLLLRYKRDKISCLVDAEHKLDTANIFSSTSGLAVVNDLSSVSDRVDALILCLVLPEGVMPLSWAKHIITAIRNNIDVINPLHLDLSKIPIIASELGGISKDSSPAVTRFNASKASIYNVRVVPEDIELFKLEVLKTKAKRVLAVGSDCNIGKMLTSLEMDREAKKRGKDSSFIATGQIGIIVKGSGIAVDRVISDFVPGAVERLILAEANRDILFIEGQGSIFQPIYSAVTMGLIHGSAPDSMILCHLPSRKKIRYTDLKMPDYKHMIRIHEELAEMIHPAKISGISLNCHDMDEKTAMDEIKKAEDQTGLPATDPIKFGVERLVDAVLR